MPRWPWDSAPAPGAPGGGAELAHVERARSGIPEGAEQHLSGQARTLHPAGEGIGEVGAFERMLAQELDPVAGDPAGEGPREAWRPVRAGESPALLREREAMAAAL